MNSKIMIRFTWFAVLLWVHAASGDCPMGAYTLNGSASGQTLSEVIEARAHDPVPVRNFCFEAGELTGAGTIVFPPMMGDVTVSGAGRTATTIAFRFEFSGITAEFTISDLTMSLNNETSNTLAVGTTLKIVNVDVVNSTIPLYGWLQIVDCLGLTLEGVQIFNVQGNNVALVNTYNTVVLLDQVEITEIPRVTYNQQPMFYIVRHAGMVASLSIVTSYFADVYCYGACLFHIEGNSSDGSGMDVFVSETSFVDMANEDGPLAGLLFHVNLGYVLLDLDTVYAQYCDASTALIVATMTDLSLNVTNSLVYAAGPTLVDCEYCPITVTNSTFDARALGGMLLRDLSTTPANPPYVWTLENVYSVNSNRIALTPSGPLVNVVRSIVVCSGLCFSPEPSVEASVIVSYNTLVAIDNACAAYSSSTGEAFIVSPDPYCLGPGPVHLYTDQNTTWLPETVDMCQVSQVCPDESSSLSSTSSSLFTSSKSYTTPSSLSFSASYNSSSSYSSSFSSSYSSSSSSTTDAEGSAALEDPNSGSNEDDGLFGWLVIGCSFILLVCCCCCCCVAYVSLKSKRARREKEQAPESPTQTVELSPIVRKGSSQADSVPPGSFTATTTAQPRKASAAAPSPPPARMSIDPSSPTVSRNPSFVPAGVEATTFSAGGSRDSKVVSDATITRFTGSQTSMAGERSLYGSGTDYDPTTVGGKPPVKPRQGTRTVDMTVADKARADAMKGAVNAGGQGGGGGGGGSRGSMASSSSAPPAPAVAKIEIDTSVEVIDLNGVGVEKVRYVGRGMFGEVFEYKWNHMPVAVKVLTDINADSLQEMIEEAQMLATLRCPYIVAYVGIAVDPLAIVTEFMPAGDLSDYLKGCVAKGIESVDLEHHGNMAFDILRGLVYLHSRGVAHRDLKPANVLLTRHKDAKISDFGLAGNKNKDVSGAGTPRYCAPEVLAREAGTIESDMYSFGILLFEIMTLQRPFAAMTSLQDRVNNPWLPPADVTVAGTFRGPHDELLRRMCVACWAVEPSQRPTAPKALSDLGALCIV